MSMDRQSDGALDGNAAGGLLRELFALDVTAAEIVCGGCGAVAEIGAVRAYGGADGRDPALRALRHGGAAPHAYAGRAVARHARRATAFRRRAGVVKVRATGAFAYMGRKECHDPRHVASHISPSCTSSSA